MGERGGSKGKGNGIAIPASFCWFLLRGGVMLRDVGSMHKVAGGGISFPPSALICHNFP